MDSFVITDSEGNEVAVVTPDPADPSSAAYTADIADLVGFGGPPMGQVKRRKSFDSD